MITDSRSKRQEYEDIRLGIVITDSSELQKIEFTGSGALDALNRVVLGDVSRLAVGRLLATYMLNPDGSVLADVYIWNRGDGYLVFGETKGETKLADEIAATAHSDLEHKITDVTNQIGLIALDGPFSWEFLKDEISVRMLGLRYLEVMRKQQLAGIAVDVMRAGKTGEFGYLLHCAAAEREELANRILTAGKSMNVRPCGSEAMHLARLENRFTNMKREGSEATNVLELNCRIQVSREKGEYTGQEAVEAAIDSGIERRVIGISFDESSGPLPEIGAAVSRGGEVIGTVASADFSYGLNKRIGVAFLKASHAYVGCSYDVAGAGAIHTVSAPFVFNRSLTIRPQEDSIHSVEWSTMAATAGHE